MAKRVVLAIAVLCFVLAPQSGLSAGEIGDAVVAGDIARVKRLLDADPKLVNAKGVGDWTPLYSAVLQGNSEIVELLMARGADVNAASEEGYTPLFLAMRPDRRETAELLIAKGADIHAVDKKGETLLHRAASYDNKTMMERFLALGLDLNARTKSGQTVLHYAAGTYRGQVVEMVIARGADVRAKDRDGATPLHYAWSDKAIGLLIDHGADVNARDNRGRTPLHWAAGQNSYRDSAKTLIARGADVNATDQSGRTPLDIAIEKRADKRLIELLTSRKATGSSGAVQMQAAVDAGDLEKVRKLLDSDPQLAVVKYTDDYTPLHRAARKGRREIAELLIAKGAKVDAVAEGWLTPLDLAAREGHSAVAEVLIDKGANVNARSGYQSGYQATPIQAARNAGDLDMVKLLVSKGASVPGPSYNTPKHPEIERFFQRHQDKLRWDALAPGLLALGLVQIVIAGAWWRRVAGETPPAETLSPWVAQSTAGLYVLLLVGTAVAFLLKGPRGLLWSGPVFVVHLAATIYLFRRPWFLLPWSVGAVASTAFLFAMVLAMGSTFLSMGVAAPGAPGGAHAVLTCAVLSLVFGTLAGLRLETLWRRRAAGGPLRLRKDSVVAVVLGVLLLGLAGFTFFAPSFAQGVRTGFGGGWLALSGMSFLPQLGIVCLWYPLMRRPRVPEDAASTAVCRLAGVLYLATLVSLVLTMLFYMVMVLPVLIIHVAASVFLFRRPRLILSWSLGVMMAMSAPLFATVATLPSGGGDGFAAKGAELMFLFAALGGMVGGTILGLPIACLWPARTVVAQAKVRRPPVWAFAVGLVLLAATFILVLQGIYQVGTALPPFYLLWFMAPIAAQAGIVLMWWYVARRNGPASGPEHADHVPAAGWLYIVIMLAAALPSAVMGLGAFVWIFPVLAIQLAAGVFLLRRPRLALIWSLGILIVAPIVLIYGFQFDLRSSIGTDAGTWEVLAYLRWPLLIPVGLALGSLIGLPLAWLWRKRAVKP